MAGKRILIASPYPLLNEGLNRMLASQPGIDAVEVFFGAAEELPVHARTLQTDVILIVIQPGETASNVASLLECATTCLINVRIGDNTLHIYRREVVHEGQWDDVVSAILADC